MTLNEIQRIMLEQAVKNSTFKTEKDYEKLAKTINTNNWQTQLPRIKTALRKKLTQLDKLNLAVKVGKSHVYKQQIEQRREKIMQKFKLQKGEITSESLWKTLSSTSTISRRTFLRDLKHLAELGKIELTVTNGGKKGNRTIITRRKK